MNFEGDILDNIGLENCLEESAVSSKIIKEKLAEATETEVTINAARM